MRLPIDSLLPEIVASLGKTPNLVIEAPPGAGKTTRVPAALLAAGMGEVLVLEPRRLAARLAARRVAAELGERPGETVGYQVRFEDVGGPKTRLRFLTEGVLTRRLLSDGALRGVQVVVLDEFHERHLDGDLALALLLDLQRRKRPDLRLVVMSATLDAAPIAAHLGGCPVLRSEGKLYPMEVEYTPHSGATLEQLVAGGVERLARQGLSGDVLVFLPGIAEMRRAQRLLGSFRTVLLHGDLTPEEQDLALELRNEPKVILATNVAESSITIPGVTAVVDSGLARVAVDSPWTGMPSVEVARVSQASATQRAGRSARTAPGRVVRLYSREEFVRRPLQDAPEITRRELSQLLVNLHGCAVKDPLALPWLTPPPGPALAAAETLLGRLGVVANGALTPLGRQIAQLPVHPRLGRLIVDGGEDGCRAAAVLSTGERLEGKPPHLVDSDLFLLLERPWGPQTVRTYEQLRRAVRPPRKDDEALLVALTAAFSDRLGKRRPNGEILLAAGGQAALAESSGVRQAELVVAIEMENRGTPLIRLASKVEPEWLLDLFPERMESRDGVEWNRTAERVERVSALLFDGMVIEETRSGGPEAGAAAELLAAKALEAGMERFADVSELMARWRFAGMPAPDLQRAISGACYGLRSFAELKGLLGDGGLERILLEGLADRALLEAKAPERVKLAKGRSVAVHYVDGQPPWVASRLQDFFGMRETPRAGDTPVVVHLLAPNQRPVQVTRDLAGFWERHYPALRRELGRRYPRHAWPEDPLAG